MPTLAPIRVLTFTACAVACAVGAAQSLPANPPTRIVGPTLPSATSAVAPLNATAPATTTTTRAKRAQVLYAGGLISINANNSSLNQILRDIAGQTGMKITGGVREERVFGHYGPAAPADILATLIDGTGTNMLLRQSDLEAPVELVLTPRGGGPTPPNPSAPGFDDGEQGGEDRPAPPRGFPGQAQAPPRPFGAVNAVQQPANVLGNPQNVTPTASQIPTTNSVPVDTLPTPTTTTQTSQGIVDTPNQPSNATTNATTPTTDTTTATPATTSSDSSSSDSSDSSKAKTPEEIYEQLKKLQQKSSTPQ